MTDRILIKRSLTSGSIPPTSSLLLGELAINVPDGKLFLKQSGSGTEVVRSLLTLDTPMSGNIILSGSILLENGQSLQATNFSGSLFGTSSWATNATTASFAISSSQAVTASFAVSASWAPSAPAGVTSITAGDGLTGGTITSTGTIALDTGSIHFLDGVKKELNTEGVISSSLQINTGSFSGSFRGTFAGDGSQLTGVVASGVGVTITDDSIVQGNAGRLDFGNFITATVSSNTASIAVTLPAGTVSSSLQINTGSFSGSFTGTLLGTSSWANNAISSSFATTSSAATSITFIPSTASFATSASFAPTNTGVVSSSTQIDYTQLQNIPTGIVSSSTQVITLLPVGTVSSSTQINTGSFSGSFIGTLIGTSSWATSASFAVTASHVLATGLPSGIISSSAQVIASLPVGTVSSSLQINTGSFSGSFTGNLIGTSSWAISSSQAVTASFAVSASWAPSSPTGVTSVTAGAGLTGGEITSTGTITLDTGSVHFLDGVKQELNTEGVISSSLQINTGSFSGSFTGNFIGTSSWASNSISSSFASTASFAISSSQAVTASFAVSSSFAPTNAGVVSSSTQINYTQLQNIPVGIVSSSGQVTSLLPSGVVSSSLQINTGSFSGSFRGTFIGTSSWATNAISASYAPPTFIDNLVTVGLPGSDTNFTSIKAAVDSITDASVSNRYTVKVYPGIYIEDTISLKSFVSVTGDGPEATIVSASNPSASLFLGADQAFISDLRIDGVTAPSQSAILYLTSQSVASQGIMYVENVRFGANYTHAKMYPVSGGNAAMQLTNIKYGAQPFTLGFYITSDGLSTGRMLLRNTTTTAGGIQSTNGLVFAKTDQPNCTLLANLVGLTKVGSGPAQGIGYWVENGGLLRINTSNLQRFATGIHVPQVGASPTIDAVGLNFENCTTDVNVIHSGSLGKIAGTDNFLKTLINKNAPLYEVNKDPRRIKVGKKGADFSSISASVAFITDSAEDNRYVIEVGPGQYTENTIDLTGKPYVSIVGSNIQTTQIFPSSSTQHIIKMGVNNEISFLTLANAGSGYAAIYVDDVGDFAQAHKISIYDSDIGIQVVSRTQDTQFFGEYVDINGTFSYGTYVSASNNAPCTVNVENYYLFPSGCAAIGNYVTHPSASLGMHACTFQGDNTTGAVAIKMESGAQVEGAGLDIQDWDCGIKVPNIGEGPNFRLVGTMIHGSAMHDMDILNPTTRGRYQGVSDHTMITNVSPDVYWNFLDDNDGENDVTRKLSVTFADGTHTDATTLIFKGSSMGVLQGGKIVTSSGLTVTAESGFGYLHDPIDPEVFKRFDWINGNITLAANSTNYLFIDSTGTLTSAPSTPNFAQNIILGRVVTNDTGVEFIDQSGWNAEHTSNRLSKFTREALGPVFADGAIVSEDAVPFRLDVTAGNYYFAENNFTPTGTSSINLTQYYPSASTWARYTSSVVPSNTYASSSQLVPMSASAYTKHTVYLVGAGVDEKYFLVINDNQYATLVQAENAALPTIPTYFDDGVVPLAAVYVQSGSANITQIQDIRPIIGFRAAGVNASSVHGNLLGLNADDHPQYLLVNGTRAMTGNLSMGGNNITNVGTMFGTASWANNAISSSFATTASAATSITFTPVSSSFSTTASFAISSSQSVTASNAISSSFATTASAATSITFTPSTASFAINSNQAITASFALTASYFSGSLEFTNGLIVTGSITASVGFTGSFFGTLVGTSSWAVSSSRAITAANADLLDGLDSTVFATTGSNAFVGNQRITGSLILSSSLPTELQVIGDTEITGSLRMLGSITSSAGFSGSLTGLASNAVSSSFSTTASFANTAPFSGLTNVPTLVSNSSQIDVRNTTGIATIATTGSNVFVGNQTITGSLILSSSLPVELRVIGDTEITGSLRMLGGITGSVFGTSSWAISSVTASYFSGSIEFIDGLDITGSLIVTGSQSITGSLNVTRGITGSLLGTGSWANNAISSSFATTASFAISASWAPGGSGTVTSITAGNGLTGGEITSTGTITLDTGSAHFLDGVKKELNTESVISSSAQVSYTQLQNIPAGIVSSSAQVISLLPTGTVSSSLQINTGSFSGSFTGTLTGTGSWAQSSSVAISSSFATTASFALNAGGSGFPYDGTTIPAVISGSLIISGSTTQGLFVTGSTNFRDNLTVNGGTFVVNAPTNRTTVSGSLAVTGSTDILGNFTATTKSFKIDHQRLPGKSLVYGVLEGPEHAVYARGRVQSVVTGTAVIQLPEDWEWLVDENSITVQLTPIDGPQELYVQNIENNMVTIKSKSAIDCFYLVHATRKDVAPLITVE